MAKQAVVPEAKDNLFVRIRDFYHEVLAEMSKVTWPSWDELKSSTSVVLILLMVMAGVIYVYDVVFQFSIVGLFRLI